MRSNILSKLIFASCVICLIFAGHLLQMHDQSIASQTWCPSQPQEPMARGRTRLTTVTSISCRSFWRQLQYLNIFQLRFVCVRYGANEDRMGTTTAANAVIKTRVQVIHHNAPPAPGLGSFITQHGCCPRRWLDGFICLLAICWLSVVRRWFHDFMCFANTNRDISQ